MTQYLSEIAEITKRIDEITLAIAMLSDSSAGVAETNKVVATKAPSTNPALTNPTANTLTVTASAPTVVSGQIGIGSATASTVGAAGAASALPATPEGYLTINVAGTDRKIPFYLS